MCGGWPQTLESLTGPGATGLWVRAGFLRVWEAVSARGRGAILGWPETPRLMGLGTYTQTGVELGRQARFG